MTKLINKFVYIIEAILWSIIEVCDWFISPKEVQSENLKHVKTNRSPLFLSSDYVGANPATNKLLRWSEGVGWDGDNFSTKKRPTDGDVEALDV